MFEFRLELEDGTPAEPSTLTAAVPNWETGNTIHLGHRTLHVVEVRPGVDGGMPVLVVVDTAEEDVA
jgi:hypothetical protein